MTILKKLRTCAIGRKCIIKVSPFSYKHISQIAMQLCKPTTWEDICEKMSDDITNVSLELQMNKKYLRQKTAKR
jgi:hypothetical protein